VKEAPQRLRRSAGERETGDAEQDRQPVELGDARVAEVSQGNNRRAESKLTGQRDEPKIDRCHSHEPIVLGREQPGDDQGGCPGEDLAGPFRAARPRNAAQQRSIELPQVGRGLGGGGRGDRGGRAGQRS